MIQLQQFLLILYCKIKSWIKTPGMLISKNNSMVMPVISANPEKEKVQPICILVHLPNHSSAAIFPLFPGERNNLENLNIVFHNDLLDQRQVGFIHNQGNTTALTGFSRSWRNPGFDVALVKFFLKKQPHMMIGE